MNHSNLKKLVKHQAGLLGFTLAGFTSPERPPHFDTFTRWLEAKRHGDMLYLSNERSILRRSDPRLVLPECKSILVLAVPYRTPTGSGSQTDEVQPRRSNVGSLQGRIASYAWGEDYHDVLPSKLNTLVAYIETQIGNTFPYRYYTDTGPILERDLAQRAGLGWIGKNTCLINPKQGSYLLLAEILLGLEIPPDDAFTGDHCGTCTRCIQACPTGCILPDRTIDARRCISYLTIENKVGIPETLRPALGNWVFGCDLCQMVCPWNRFATGKVDASFAPRADLGSPDLTKELTLSPQVFNRKFKGSTIKRAKRRGYLRNAAVALGNSLDRAAIPFLEKVTRDSEALIREHASWALKRIRTNGNE